MQFAHDFITTSHKVVKHPYIGLFFAMIAVMAFYQRWRNERVDVNGVN